MHLWNHLTQKITDQLIITYYITTDLLLYCYIVSQSYPQRIAYMFDSYHIKMYCVRVLIVIFSYFCKVHVTAAEDVLLELGELGSVLGRRELFEYTLDPYQLSREVYVFRGIPFAEVPTGQLRFAKPKPKQPWGGVWNGTHYRNMCHQFIPSFSRLDAPPQDEDCLHLNIWSRDIYNVSVPSPPPKKKKKFLLNNVHRKVRQELDGLYGL